MKKTRVHNKQHVRCGGGKAVLQGLSKIKTPSPKCQQRNQIDFFTEYIKIISIYPKRYHRQPLRKWCQRDKEDSIWDMRIVILRSVMLLRMQRNWKPLSIIGWNIKMVQLWNSMAVPLNSTSRIILQSWDVTPGYVSKIIKSRPSNWHLNISFWVWDHPESFSEFFVYNSLCADTIPFPSKYDFWTTLWENC